MRNVLLCTFESSPRPARTNMTERAMLLKAEDHLCLICMLSLMTGIFLMRNPASSMPRRGGSGGNVGNLMSPKSLPPVTAQQNRIIIPNRFPPGRHSLPVIDQTTAHRRTTMVTFVTMLSSKPCGGQANVCLIL